MAGSVSPEEAIRLLEETTGDLAAAGAGVSTESLLTAMRTVGARVRDLALRNRHSIGVRVGMHGDRARLTITGRDAMRYRAIAERELDAQMPGIQADIRAQITRRPK